jgi:hypothetical protein
MLIIMFAKNFLFLRCQSQEETGAAGGQLVSNKTDAYTIGKGVEQPAPFLLLSVCCIA